MAGVLTDAVAGTGGAWTLAYTLFALVCGGITRGFFADGVVLPSLFVGVAVVVRSAIFWIIMAAEGYPRGYGAVHLHAALESALLTGRVRVRLLAVPLALRRRADAHRTLRVKPLRAVARRLRARSRSSRRWPSR